MGERRSEEVFVPVRNFLRAPMVGTSEKRRRTTGAQCSQLLLTVVLKFCFHLLAFILLLLQLLGETEHLLFVFVAASVQSVHVLRRRCVNNPQDDDQ